ncbi:MAG: hypothetical protein IPL26_15565 [Leptospiraceae bacterium]|nr:hypothetical protein [Leptospiraceae bacterium]
MVGSLNDAKITLNPVGTACGSLVKNKTINIDTIDPSITNITSRNPNGTICFEIQISQLLLLLMKL